MMKDVAIPTKSRAIRWSLPLRLLAFSMLVFMVFMTHNVQAQTFGNINFSEVALDPTFPPGNLDRTQLRLQGDFTMFGNNITSVIGGPTPFNNRATSGTNNNGRSYQYVDIDTDPTTFSSSSADFINPSGCSRVVYAGLYWTSTYYIRKLSNNNAQRFGLPVADDRNGPAPNGDGLNLAFGLPPTTTFRDIKIQLPGETNYRDISVSDTPTADGTGVIFDGWRNTPTFPFDNGANDMPYLCYANITNLVQGLANPEGTYTVANIRSTVGPSGNGVSGGWTMVIIYEDPSLSRKLITSRSGFKQIRSTASGAVDFRYDNFETLPAPNPIRAKFGIVSLEGDTAITGDELLIFDTSGTPRRLSTNPAGDLLNEPTNFFDSSISLEGSLTTGINRNPFALNTLGMDIDVFTIANPGNTIIGNMQPLVDFRITTQGDSYTALLATFSVEIIEPELVVKKRVLDLAGNDITGDPVNLGQTVRYQLTIQNQGNESITNAFITDRLPENINFDFSDPSSFTFDSNIITNLTFDEPTRTLRFEIEDDFVERFDGEFTFEFQVSVIDDCEDITDACSNSIDNVARSTYTGVESTVTRTGENSILDQDPVCRFDIVGTSNVIVGFAELQAECNDAFNAFACSFPYDLTADGDGFVNYNWTNTTTGTFIANSRTITINSPGVYTVVKTGSPDSCDLLEEVWTVDAFAGVTNPIIDVANDPAVDGNIRNCAVNGQALPELFLCGASASIDLDSGFAGATSIVWERLDETACTVPRDPNCPTVDPVCAADWVVVSSIRTYTADQSGEYRIRADFGGCPVTFYFNVFKNEFDPMLDIRDEIICGAGGRLEVTNSASQYEYELRLLSADGSSSSVAVPYTTDPVFSNITVQGTYFVNVRLVSSPADCVFESNQVFLPNRAATVTPTVVQPQCVDDRGTIRLSVANGVPNYTYRIQSTTGPFTAEIPSTVDTSAEFTGLTVGDYDVEVLANDNDANCLFTQTITITQQARTTNPVATLNRDLSCNPNYQPDPALCADDTDPGFVPCDFDEFIALFEVNVAPTPTVPPVPNYAYAINFGGVTDPTRIPISPELGTSNLFRVNENTNPGTPVAAGDYHVFVTDLDSGCEEYAGVITVSDYTPLAATATLTPPFCPGDLGSIRVDVSAGEGPFEYVLDAGLASEQTLSGDPSEVTSGSQTFTNLAGAVAPGREYTIQVTDRFGCDLAVLPNIFIVNPVTITADIGVTQARCDATGTGVIQGQISITNPQNGTAPYAYSIDGTDFSNTTGVFTGLANGTYTLYIRDANTTACPVNLGDRTIDPLNPPTDITYTFPGASSCSAQSVSVTPQAVPVGPTYTYSVTPAPISENAGVFRLRRGDIYTFRATNTTTGCIYEETFTEDTLPEIRITTAVETSPVSCTGLSDGEFSFTVTNTTGFDYDVIDSANTTVASGSASGTDPITVNITSGLAAGTYTIEVRDTSNTPPSNNCEDDTTVTITEPAVALAITGATPTNDGCTAADTGTITVNATGGRGAYEYELRNSAGTVVLTAYQSNNVFSDLAAGDYQVFVRDSNTAPICEESTAVTVGQDTPATIALAGGDLCFDSVDQASRIVTITGGVGPYTYSLNGGAPVAAVSPFTIPNLTPDSYTVSVTDSNNCTTNVLNFDIEPELTISAALTKDQDCSASPAATISLSASGGNGVRSFEINTNGGGYVAYGGPFPFVSPIVTTATTYQFRVTDSGIASGGAANCVAESAVFTVNPSPLPQVNAPTIVRPTCNGDSDGRVTINVNTAIGEAPYLINFNGLGNSTDTEYGGLAAGTYNYTVTDDKNCSDTFSVTVGQPDAISGTINETDISCGGTGNIPGEIEITGVSGGTGLYTYSLLNLDNTLATTSSTNPVVATAATSATFAGLAFGDFRVRVVDANDCAMDFPARIETVPIFTITESATADCTDGVTIDINVFGGTGNFRIREYMMGLPPASVANTVPLNGPSFGLTADEHRIENLPFDTPFVYEIYDQATNCTDIQTVMPPPNPSTIVISGTENNVSCQGDGDGSFDYNISGYQGTELTLSVFNVNDLSTDLVGSVPLTIETIETFPTPPSPIANPQTVPAGGSVTGRIRDFAPGNYLLRVVETDGGVATPCNAAFSFSITEPSSALDLDFVSATTPDCNDSTSNVVMSVNGGTPFGASPFYRFEAIAGTLGTTTAPDPNDPGAFPLTSSSFALNPATSTTWAIYVVDGAGCVEGVDITIPAATANPTVTVPPYGDCIFGGSYDIVATGTVFTTSTNVRYQLDGGAIQSSNTFTVTSPGTYSVVAIDDNGCPSTPAVVTVFPDLNVDASFTVDADCTTTGTLVVGVSGGSDFGSNPGNFMFTLDDGTTTTGPQASNTFAGIARPTVATTYTITVTDDRGGAPQVSCVGMDVIDRPAIVDPDISATATNPQCNGGVDGVITASLAAGTDLDPPYTYQLFDISGIPFQVGLDQIDNPVFTGTVANPISAGTNRYEVRVASNEGCTDVTTPITVGEPTAITASAPSIGNYSCDAMNNGDFPEVSITISGGTPPYRISYTAPTPANSVSNAAVVDGDAVTPGLQYVFTAIESGLYSGITIVDSNNCPQPVADAPVPTFPIMSTPTVTQVTAIDCFNSAEVVDVHITGGSSAGNFVFTEILSGITPTLTQTVAAGTGDGVGVGTAPGVQTVARFSLPAAGNYQFEIRDATTNCTIRTTPVYTVAEFNTIEAVLSNPMPITCFNTPVDGSLDLTINGYSGPYQYTITTVNSSGTTTSGVLTADSSITNPEPITSLSAGNITIQVTALSGGVPSTVCIDDSNTVNIAPAPTITITTAEQVNPESCTPGDDASIQIAAIGGTGALSYKIEQPVGTVVVDYGLNPNTNAGLFTGLDAGATPAGLTYRVYARDSRNCEVFQDVTIFPPVALGVTSPATLSLDCSDSIDGVIDATASGGLGSGAGGTGTGEYFFQITFPDGTQSSAVPSNGLANGLTAAQHRFIGLSAGAYVITVTDGTVGCSATSNTTLTAPTPVAIEVTPSGFSCTTPNPSMVQATASGGTGPYTYFYIEANDATMTEVPETVAGSGAFSGLPNGDYDFYARDANMCVSPASDRIPIRTPEALMANLDMSNLNIVCFDEATASIDITNVRGGVGNYSYRIEGTEAVSGATVTLPGPLSTDTQSDSFFNGLRAGTYTYFVNSGTGPGACTEVPLAFTVTQPAEFVVPPPVVQDITCNGEVDGQITITASGGNVANPGDSRYFYSLFDSAGNTVFQFIEDEVDNVLGSHTFDGLAAGIYRVEVEDSRGCVIPHDNLEIVEPPLIVPSIITGSLTPEECAGDRNGTARISITGGTQPALPASPEYYVSRTGDAGSYQLVADPTNFFIDGLAGGTNTIFIRDSRNSSDCEIPFNIDIVPGVEIAATLVDRKDCPVIDASGAVTEPVRYFVNFNLTANADPSRADGVVGPNDIVYTLTGINGTPDPAANTNLTGEFEVPPGEYQGMMLHSRGCEVSAGEVMVEEYVPLSMPVGVMTGNPRDPNEYAINVTGGVATAANPYVYFAFQGADGVDPLSTYEAVLQADGTYVLQNSSTQEVVANPLEDNIFLVRETDTYTIWVVDATGCSVVAQQEITYINIRIPNYFRPNDPNASLEERFWYPRQITPDANDPFFFENMEVKVFDRYGRLLEEFRGDQQGWNGIYQGKELPSGDYWFTIILNDAENKEFTGHFTLYR